jgi:iron complex outermembrane receptor protein
MIKTEQASRRPVLKALPLAIALASTTSFTAVHTNASAMMEEVTVTAQKREENIQDVPIAISAFSGDAIKEMGATNISDLGKATAGVEMNNNGALQPTYNIRGIQTSDFTVGSDPAVAIYVDGVYASRGAGAEVPFSDVERVEILKGPQGTLFGRNATGGAIHLITKKPNLEEAEGSVTTSIGNYNKRDIDFGYSAPLSDTLAFRVSGTVNRRDGWQDNAFGQDTGNEDNHTIRASLLWTPTDATEVIFRASYGDMDQNTGTVATTVPSVFAAGNGATLDDSYSDVQLDGGSFEERDMFSTSIELNHEFENFTFTSITAYSGFNSDFYNDEDGSASSQHHFNSDNIDDQDQFSQELRFTGETENLKWTTGLTWSREHVDHITVAEFNNTTLETFATYEALKTNVDAFVLLSGGNPAFLGSNFGLDATSTESEIANAVGDVRALVQLAGIDGVAIASFLDQLLGAGDGALIAGFLPGIQATFLNTPDALWEETVRNIGTYESTAIYGDATYALSETTNLTVGLRYTYDEKEFATITGYQNTMLGAPLGLAFYNNGVDAMFVPDENSDDWSAVSGRIVLDHWIDDEVMVYGSVSTGFKSGGFNSLSFGAGIEPSFDQEEVINYEIGLKGDFYDGKVRLNAAAYYYEYSDLQELSLVGAPIPSYNLRTADAEGQGVDIEVMWSATDNLFIAANYSYLDTEYTDYQILPAAGETPADDKTGLPRADTPENKFNIMAEYTMALDDIGELVLRGDYNWTDERESNTSDIPVDDYEYLNLRATLHSADDAWAVSAWAQNVTNEEIHGGYGGPAKAIGSETTWLFLPRTYGLDLTYNF